MSIPFVVKFVFDRLVSAIGLVLIMPVLLAISIIIMVNMSCPIFFIQERIGKNGARIKIHKFRTMRALTENEPITGVAAKETMRITPLGRVLRRYKLDELPELWDVVIGNMSFVGPRPDVPGYADALVGEDREVLKLRPGITGPASLKYRNEEELLANVDDPQKYNDEVIFPDKVRINLYYLHHYSFWMDIKMIFATVFGKHIEYGGEII